MNYEEFNNVPGQSVSLLNNDSEWNRFVRFSSENESELEVHFLNKDYKRYMVEDAFSKGLIPFRELEESNGYEIKTWSFPIVTTYRDWAKVNEPLFEVTGQIRNSQSSNSIMYRCHFIIHSPLSGHIVEAIYCNELDNDDYTLYTLYSPKRVKELNLCCDLFNDISQLDKVEVRFNEYLSPERFTEGMPTYDFEAEDETPCLLYDWKVSNFDIVVNGMHVCSIIKNPYGSNRVEVKIYSPKTGIIVMGKNWYQKEYRFLENADINDLFTIYQDRFSIIKNRYYSIEEVTTDSFDGTVSLTWNVVAGRFYDNDNSYFFCEDYTGFEMSGNSGKNIIVSLRVKSNIPYIVFCVNSRLIRLSNGDFVDMLFKDDNGNNTILSFPITLNRAEEVFADVYDTSYYCELSESDVSCMTDNECVGWRIRLSKQPMMSITGENGSRWCPKDFAESVFCIYAEKFGNLVEELQEQYPIKYSSDNKSADNAILDDTCYVYLMHDTSNDYYKIGISNNPEYRERTLQSEKPTIEKVCAKEFPNRTIAIAIENALHKAFDSKRIRGEWFSLTDADIIALRTTLE